MNCEKFADMLDNYACLSDAELQELEEHAAVCESCADDLAFMRSILGTAKSLPPIEPPVDFLDSVNSRLDAELAKEAPVKRLVRRSVPFVSRYGAVAACVALSVAVGVNAGMLTSRMNNDGTGVISEETTTADSNDGTDSGIPAVNDEVIPADEDAIPAPAEPIIGSDLGKVSSPALSVTSEPSKDGSKGTSAATRNGTVRTASVPKKSQAPIATSQPLAQRNGSVNSTTPVLPAASVSEVISTHNTSEPQSQIAETKAPTLEPTATPDSEPGAASASYMMESRMITVSDEYAVAPTETEQPEDTDSDYTIAHVDNTQSRTYAALNSTVSIKAADSERVKELIDVFVYEVYGKYYAISSQDMNGLLGQFDREGIWYEANVTESNGRISFKLIIL